MKHMFYSLLSMTLMLLAAGSLQAQNELALFELKGPVAKVVPDIVDTGDLWMTYFLEFSPEGTLQKAQYFSVLDPRNGSYEVKKDASGRIVQLDAVEGEGIRIVRYHYDGSGRVTGQDWSYDNIDFDEVFDMGKTRITYDGNGNKVKVVIEHSDGTPSEIITYTDYQFDARGNWISRKMTWPGQYDHHLETREITYF